MIYESLLVDKLAALPPRIRDFHLDAHATVWAGTAEVHHGRNIFALLIRGLFGFPKAGENIPLKVHIHRSKRGEVWTRTFGDKTLRSSQSLNRHGKLVERFGPISVTMKLILEGKRLYLLPQSWSCLGLPMPDFLLPSGQTYEGQQGSYYAFHVEILAPLIGHIITYKGVLTPQTLKHFAPRLNHGKRI